MAETPIRNLRVDSPTWDGAQAALGTVTGPRRVVVVLHPGMSRSAAIVAFLRALCVVR